MGYVSNTIAQYWNSGRKTRKTPSGWISGNSVCCVHNGERADTRGRAGLFVTAEGGIIYSCFNCGFKASWHPGKKISKKIRDLAAWMGVPDQEIKKIAFHALKNQSDEISAAYDTAIPQFSYTPLPDGVQAINYANPTENPQLQAIIDYAKQRKLHTANTTLYWTPEPAYANRIIIPFVYGKKTVGWSARTILPKKNPKYISESQPGFVYNMDSQTYDKKYCIVCEGIFDAMLIDGCALLSNEIGKQQATLLNSLNKQIILLPDRDASGKKSVEQALDLGWAVSFPPWDSGIKDAADAVQRYGTLYTLYAIIQHTQYTSLKIKLAAKTWFNTTT